ncbi:MAG: MFS transporter [Gammaproteobacteria bacterium]|jgi:MFS transporter, OFA family, oxalate/formate antiporter|nr:MFS transporter [Gammaproteobacteria bacterium]
MKQAQYSLRANWPFPVNTFPFFYGWVIWFVSALGIIVSIPGQTVGMAVFTNHFIDVFGLTRTQLSTAYLIGTLGSAALLTRAGRFYDQVGARTTIVASSIFLGVCLTFIAVIDYFAAIILNVLPVSIAWVTFPLILAGYFGVRFSGQGVLTSAARNVLLVWFEKRRGLVSGARAVFVTLGFSLAPPFLAYLIHIFGWRMTLLVLALIVGIGYSLLAIFLIRNSPEACGLRADGHRGKYTDEEDWSIPNLTPSEAKRNPVFWLYAAVLGLYSLFGTALVFHVVSIFNEAGRPAEQAFTYFFPAAIFSVSVNLFGSWLSDYWSLKRLLIIKLTGFMLGAWGILHLQYDWGYWLLVCGFGTTSGMWGVLSNLAFIRFFGRRFLGEISGMNMSLTVMGSAIGPVMFSLGLDIFGSYHAAIWLNMLLIFVLLLAAIIIKQEEPERIRKT